MLILGALGALFVGLQLFVIVLAAIATMTVTIGTRPFDPIFDSAMLRIVELPLGDQLQLVSMISMAIYAGYLLAKGGLEDRLAQLARSLLGWMPGGLELLMLGAGAAWGVAPVAPMLTLIALGVALGRKSVSGARIASGESFGFFGALFSARALWVLGGTTACIVWFGLLAATAIAVGIVRRRPRTPFRVRELVVAFMRVVPELLIPFGVIVGLLAFDVIEIAALTVIYVVVLELALARVIPGRDRLELEALWTVGRDALALAGAVVISVLALAALTSVLLRSGVSGPRIGWINAFAALLAVGLLLTNKAPVADLDRRGIAKTARWLDDKLGRIEQFVCFALLVALVAVGVAEAAIHALGRPSLGVGWFSLLRGCTFAITMLGAAFATQRRRHPSLDVLTDRIPAAAWLVLRVIVAAITVTICAYVARSGFHVAAIFVETANSHGDQTALSADRLTYVFPVTFILIIVHTALQLAIDLSQNRRVPPTPS